MIQLNHKKDEEILELAERLIAEIEAHKEGLKNNSEKNFNDDQKPSEPVTIET